MLCALIIAGGTGKRFWPLSTEENPKQLLKLFSDKTLVRETVDRILPLVPVERIFVATQQVQADAIIRELPMIPEENIIIEPMVKDTAAAIGYSALYIRRQLGNVTMIVLPSDHMIKKEVHFRIAVSEAEEEASKSDSIVTFGIKATRPDTGYGYIRVKEVPDDMTVIDIEEFLEKPTHDKAEEYVAQGNYLWNSGIFVFKPKTILKEIETYLPKHYRVLKNMQFYIDQGHVGKMLTHKISLLFEDFEKVSLDYGIMEKSKIVKVLPMEVGWSDVGSFNAFEDVYEPDEKGNIIRESIFDSFESSGNIILTESLEIKAIGLEDMVIVQKGNKLLICNRYEIDKMKEII